MNDTYDPDEVFVAAATDYLNAVVAYDAARAAEPLEVDDEGRPTQHWVWADWDAETLPVLVTLESAAKRFASEIGTTDTHRAALEPAARAITEGAIK